MYRWVAELVGWTPHPPPHVSRSCGGDVTSLAASSPPRGADDGPPAVVVLLGRWSDPHHSSFPARLNISLSVNPSAFAPATHLVRSIERIEAPAGDDRAAAAPVVIERKKNVSTDDVVVLQDVALEHVYRVRWRVAG